MFHVEQCDGLDGDNQIGSIVFHVKHSVVAVVYREERPVDAQQEWA
jgi:hypothetical protein